MKTFKARYYFIPVVICLAALAVIGYYYTLTPFMSASEKQYLYIDDDDTADSVFHKLEPMASTHAMTGLRTLMRHHHYEDHVHTGRYAITPGDNIITVARQLWNGHQEPLTLTIPESRTMELLAGRLGSKLMLDSANVAAALTDSGYVARYGYTIETLPTLFVPNTYEVYWNTSLDHLMERMVKEHRAFWNDSRTAKAQQAGLTENEVCTLASILDEETANNQEKPMIAGMYLNRLHRDMPLQADPTVKFALKDFALRRIYHSMLTVDSPYNTYRYAGLPPGPIKIASIKGIDAVLDHAHHDYIYMCAKEDFSGTHNFASTYQEHLKNAAKYAKALNQRGIK